MRPWLTVNDPSRSRSLAFRSQKEWVAVAGPWEIHGLAGEIDVPASTFDTLARALALRREMPTLTTREGVLRALRGGQPVVQVDTSALQDVVLRTGLGNRLEVRFLMRDTWRVRLNHRQLLLG